MAEGQRLAASDESDAPWEFVLAHYQLMKKAKDDADSVVHQTEAQVYYFDWGRLEDICTNAATAITRVVAKTILHYASNV